MRLSPCTSLFFLQAYVPEFKLVLVGDGGVGKTTYVKRHKVSPLARSNLAFASGCGAPLSSLCHSFVAIKPAERRVREEVCCNRRS